MKELDIENSKRNRRAQNSYTTPGEKSFLDKIKYWTLNRVPRGIKQVAFLSKTTEEDAKDEGLDDSALNDLAAILTPPSERYATVVTPEVADMSTQMDNLAQQQLAKQFYEVYIAPVGFKDVYNRLGEIAGNIEDVHLLYPNGLKGLIGADPNASWRTNLNFSFQVDEGLKDSKGKNIYSKYSSLAFPPFISHDTYDINSLVTELKPKDSFEEDVQDVTFDMKNILYKKNRATYRFPAFKAVNDNIHTLQVLLNRCFGVESTYINEWDLSMYMQEGLCSSIEKERIDANGNLETIRIPSLVTTLTYGLLDDAPLEGNINKEKTVDIEEASMFATVNMAVSTRKGIDDMPLGTESANERLFMPSKYGYSSYWRPWEDGELNVISYDNGSFYTSDYIRTMFSYDENGDTYNRKNPDGKNYTPAVFHGKDLTHSTKTFNRVLNYTDNRYAILSGWNATDDRGQNYMKDSSNFNKNSNAYAYLPFWKQFYTTGEDGMSDIDLYMQEIIASKKDVSFLDAAYNIIGYMTENNDPFNDLKDNASQNSSEDNAMDSSVGNGNGSGTGSDEDAVDISKPPQQSGDREPSDYSFKILKVKLTIKGSRLLKMFLNRKSKTAKAQQTIQNMESEGTAVGALEAAQPTSIKNENPEETLDENGNPVKVKSFVPAFDDGLCNKKIVGDGVAEFSPFLYGGPHGRYSSPLTLEGYSQAGNENLSEVPTTDVYSLFNGQLYPDGTAVTDLSKNYKNKGSFIDAITCLTPNERNILLTGSGLFGARNCKATNKRWLPYSASCDQKTYATNPEKLLKTESSRGYYDCGVYRTVSGYYDCGTYVAYPTKSSMVDNPFYEKIHFHYDVNRPNNWKLFWGGRSENFHTQTSRTTTHKNFYVDRNEAALDFDSNFYLYPIDSQSTYWSASSSDLRSWISSDVSKLRNLYDNPASLKPGSRVWWLITPRSSNLTYSQNSNLVSTPSASYFSAGGSWEDQLKFLYERGIREIQVSLPITDSSGNVLNIVNGIAHLLKRTITSYRRRFHCHWNLHYKPYGRWWRHRFHWGCGYYYWNHYHCDYIEKTTTPAYYLCIDPGLISYNLPTEHLLEKELNVNDATSLRNKDSSNIIERWRLKSGFNHIDDGNPSSPRLFPFSLEFNNKYGDYSYWSFLPTIPNPYDNNANVKYMESLRRIKTCGVYFRDIAADYRESKTVKATTSVSNFYDQKRDVYARDDIVAQENVAWKSMSFYLGDRHYSITDWHQDECERLTRTGPYYQNLVYTADNPARVATGYREVSKLTNVLKVIQRAPTILQSFEKAGLSKMSVYNPKDVFDTYIETVISQIKWLNQLRDYVSLYIKDYLIYEVYQKSVDLQTQKIIDYADQGADYAKETDNFGYTDSYTEDINYHDALAIVKQLFNTQDKNKNTILELVNKRIKRLEALRLSATLLKSEFNSNPEAVMLMFVDLVTNTRSILNCARNGDSKAENVLFNSQGAYKYELFPLTTQTTYDLVRNPATALWAYLNVLYHVRRFWANKRFNKKGGSYWVLRGLERIMYFLLANKESEANNTADDVIATGKSSKTSNMNIQFSQPRTSFVNQIKNGADTVYTKAIYVKVNYLNTGDPTKSSKWNDVDKTYARNEVVYVDKAYKWAFKPKDGLYYIMSSEISRNVNQYLMSLKSINQEIYGNIYSIAPEDFYEVVRVLKARIENPEAGENVESLKKTLKLVEYYNELGKDEKDQGSKNTKYLINHTTELVTTLGLSAQAVTDAIVDIKNILLQYKNDFYLKSVKDNLYPIYIKWSPSKVWTGLSDIEGDYHIDEWQLKNTAGKTRTVKDFYGIAHTSNEAISAGITFDAVAGLDVGTILGSPSALQTATPLEIMCASSNTMDLWRVELPEDLLVNIKLLKDKPVLVSADLIEAGFEALDKNTITATEKTVLAGVQASTILPITEATEKDLTINSLAALGEFEIGELES